MNFTVRNMQRSELDFAIEQSTREGWNPGLLDADVFYQTDPGGFLIGHLDDKPVGCVSAVSYGNGFGFIGFFIVLPEFRARGFGIRLGYAAMKLLEGQTIGVDGVLQRQGDYKKSGFQYAHSNVRYEYASGDHPGFHSDFIVPVRQIDFAKVEAYDRQCFPAQRTLFLRKWLAMEGAFAYGWLEAGTLKGYGMIRKSHSGYRVGPLFADNDTVARVLFLKLCSHARDKGPVYLDTPDVNLPAVRLAESLDMKKVFGTARMYRGEFPNLIHAKIFGITTFELG